MAASEAARLEGLKPEQAHRAGSTAGVGGMGYSVHHQNFGEIKGAYAVQTGDVDADLRGQRAALMMGVDATDLAEIVFRRAGVELIEGQAVMALADVDVFQPRGDCNRAAHPAIAAGAAAEGLEAICQADLKPDRPAMAAAAIGFDVGFHRGFLSGGKADTDVRGFTPARPWGRSPVGYLCEDHDNFMQIVGGSPASEQVEQAFEVIAFAFGAGLFARAFADFVKQVLRAAVDVFALQQVAV